MNSNSRNEEHSAQSNASEGTPEGLSRRSFLAHAGAVTGAAASVNVWISGVSRAASSTSTKTAVVINQRGGADGLSICAPVNDPEYIAQRTTIAVAPPPVGGRAWLDGTFALSAGGVDPVGTVDLIDPYLAGDLCFVHGAGMMNQGRSHFSAMLSMEHGVNPGAAYPADGWGGRYMTAAPPSGSLVRGFSHGNLLPTVLRGAPLTSPIADVANLSFPGPDTPPTPPLIPTAPFREAVLKKAYQSTPRLLAKQSADSAFATLSSLSAISYPVPGSGSYPDTPFGNAMANTAAVIKDPNIHVEFIHLDIGSWDHHIAQFPDQPGSVMFEILKDFSTSIGAFYQDLGGPAGVGLYLLMAYTEFGRQIKKNQSDGTDHGYGSLMTVMGSGVHPNSGGAGGTVFREFGPLISSYDPINNDALTMTIDYRDVMKEALENQLCLAPIDFSTVFPNFSPRVTPPGIIG